MKYQSTATIAVFSAAALVGSASAQVGTLDQESPTTNASFNLDRTDLLWQAQVRVALDGQLEGFAMPFWGEDRKSQVNIAVGLGDAWSKNIVFQELITVQSSGDWQFINTTSANIQLVAGDTFVIQALGNLTRTEVGGSFVNPPGDPLYDEPVWLNEEIFDAGWCIAFRTYMLTGVEDCLDLSVSELVAGKTATWDVSGATSGAEVAVVYGLSRGSTLIKGLAQYCANFGIAGVSQKRIICRKKADGAGQVTCDKLLPDGIQGVRVLSQAAERNTCPDPCMSNLDEQVIN